MLMMGGWMDGLINLSRQFYQWLVINITKRQIIESPDGIIQHHL